MRKLMLFFICYLAATIANAQFTYKIKADSVRITNDSCSAELVLENSTKSIKGFLYNYGNGRTRFQRAMVNVGDSLYIIGGDTLRTRNLNSWLRGGNALTANGILGTLSNHHLDIYTNNLSRARFASNGNMLVNSTTDNSKRFQVNGNGSFTTDLTVTGTNPKVAITGDANTYYPTLEFTAVPGVSKIQGYLGLSYDVPTGNAHVFRVNTESHMDINSWGVKVANGKVLRLGWHPGYSNAINWQDRGALFYDAINQMIRVNQWHASGHSGASAHPGFVNKVNTSVLFEGTTTNATPTVST